MINFLIPSLNFLLWYLSVYNNKIVFSDFNSETSHPGMLSFMNNKNLINFVKKNKLCFKGEEPYVDLILTNRSYFFKHISSIETSLSDHHHLISTIM